MIIGCEHHSGMGLCSACARDVDEQVSERRRAKDEDLIRELERRGEPEAARRIRAQMGG